MSQPMPEQELAAVAEAMDRGQPLNAPVIHRSIIDRLAQIAVSTVNTVRAEQASAGDREAINQLAQACSLYGTGDGTVLGDEDYQKADTAYALAEAAVLARMQRPVPLTDERVELAVRVIADTPWPRDEAIGPPVEVVRAALEAALREEGEAWARRFVSR